MIEGGTTQSESDLEVGIRLRALRTASGLSLRALADASGVTASALSQIENGKNSPSVSTLKKILATYLTLPGVLSGRTIQIMDERYEVGADTGPELYSHAGEECGICIEGRIELTVNGRTEVLEPGDAFYFSSTLPHRWRNAGKGPARMIAANTPPTF
jgi:transcriptional regulator with XRE-family HTH domain